MLDLIKQRRSHRKFSDKEISKESVEQLLQAALMAPSSKRSTPWEFIVLDDKAQIESLAACKVHGSVPLKHAPLAIVIVADPAKSDVWVEDTAVAATLIQMMGESMDLGSCWIQIRERACDDTQSAGNFVKKALNIPAELEVASIITLGYKVEEKAPFRMDKMKKDVVKKGDFTIGYEW